MKDFWKFLWENKIWWITPMAIVFILFGVLVYVASQSQVAPFTYVLF